MNGGYLMVSKSDTNLYAKLNNALTVGKPILWYEDETTCYYIDTITKSGTDIILTKGGKTITIESDGTITEVGNIQPSGGGGDEVHLYKHFIQLSKSLGNYDEAYVEVLSKSDTHLTLDELKTYIGSIQVKGYGYNGSLGMGALLMSAFVKDNKIAFYYNNVSGGSISKGEDTGYDQIEESGYVVTTII